MIDASAVDRLIAVSDQAAFYSLVCEILATLRLSNEQQGVLIEAERSGLELKLVNASDTQSQLVSRLQKVELAKNDQKSTAATQAKEISSLENDIREEEAEIELLRAKIRKELKRQRNAVLDLIPLRGLIVAIKSGKRKRAIPFYSQVDGIVSAVKGRLKKSREQMEKANQRFNDSVLRSSKTKEAREETMLSIARLVAKESAFENNIYGSDRDAKATGKQLSGIREIGRHPKELLSQLDFVRLDLDFASRQGDETFRSEFIEHLRELVSVQRPESAPFSPHTLERNNGFWEVTADLNNDSSGCSRYTAS